MGHTAAFAFVVGRKLTCPCVVAVEDGTWLDAKLLGPIAAVVETEADALAAKYVTAKTQDDIDVADAVLYRQYIVFLLQATVRAKPTHYRAARPLNLMLGVDHHRAKYAARCSSSRSMMGNGRN